MWTAPLAVSRRAERFVLGRQQLDVGLAIERRQGFLAVTGEAEGEFPGADLPAETLADQVFEIRLVIATSMFY